MLEEILGRISKKSGKFRKNLREEQIQSFREELLGKKIRRDLAQNSWKILSRVQPGIYLRIFPKIPFRIVPVQIFNPKLYQSFIPDFFHRFFPELFKVIFPKISPGFFKGLLPIFLRRFTLDYFFFFSKYLHGPFIRFQRFLADFRRLFMEICFQFLP